MDRETLLNHIRATHFESGDRELALADARRIAAYLAEQGASRVVGIGRRDVGREEDVARRLAMEIESELASLTALGEELGKAPRQDDIYSLRARGSILHDFYNGSNASSCASRGSSTEGSREATSGIGTSSTT